MKKAFCTPIAALALLSANATFADAPTIENVSTQKSGASWTFSVTISHPETGWDHYADGWEVLDQDGTSLGLRVLVHPHVDEQPFTRSLGSVDMPAGTTQVSVRARDNVDGWYENLFPVTLGN